MIQFLRMGIHDIDRVSIGDTHGLVSDTGKPVQVRDLVIRSGGVKFTITLFADDSRALDFVEEG